MHPKACFGSRNIVCKSFVVPKIIINYYFDKARFSQRATEGRIKLIVKGYHYHREKYNFINSGPRVNVVPSTKFHKGTSLMTAAQTVLVLIILRIFLIFLFHF